MRAVRYGLEWSVIEIATRGSRARLRAFCDDGCVKNAIRSPSSIPPHTATEGGAPEGISVATCPKLAPWDSARTSSFSSAMPHILSPVVSRRPRGEPSEQVAREEVDSRLGTRGGRSDGRRACEPISGSRLPGPEPAVASAAAAAAADRPHAGGSYVALPQGDGTLLRRHDREDAQAPHEAPL